MNSKLPRGEIDPVEKLNQQRAVHAMTQNALFNKINDLGGAGDRSKLPAEIQAQLDTLDKAYLRVAEAEAKLEKLGLVKRSVDSVHIDCAAARDEILGRLARIRDRR